MENLKEKFSELKKKNLELENSLLTEEIKARTTEN